MRLVDLNALPAEAAETEFLRCCGSRRWARAMARARPFADVDAAASTADKIWNGLDAADWLEAFAAHPKIGESGRSGGAGGSGGSGGAAGSGWSEQEQSGVQGASEAVVQRLAEANRAYEARFGYIFIVCATGKRADEMLALLERRLANNQDEELKVAAAEQRTITSLRLAKLLA